jgi:hypothetical protein
MEAPGRKPRCVHSSNIRVRNAILVNVLCGLFAPLGIINLFKPFMTYLYFRLGAFLGELPLGRFGFFFCSIGSGANKRGTQLRLATFCLCALAFLPTADCAFRHAVFTSSTSTGKVGACMSITWLTGNRIQSLHPSGISTFIYLISSGELQNQQDRQEPLAQHCSQSTFENTGSFRTRQV